MKKETKALVSKPAGVVLQLIGAGLILSGIENLLYSSSDESQAAMKPPSYG